MSALARDGSTLILGANEDDSGDTEYTELDLGEIYVTNDADEDVVRHVVLLVKCNDIVTRNRFNRLDGLLLAIRMVSVSKIREVPPHHSVGLR
mgnify:CR=1 FL=1